MIVNRHPKLDLFTPDEIEQVHQASLEILEDVGFAFRCEEALDILEATPGTKVDRDEERVYFDRALVEKSIAQCPPSFTIHAPNPKYNRIVGGDYITISPGGGVFTHDLERGRRRGLLGDSIELAKLGHMLTETLGAGIGGMNDVPAPLRVYVGPLVRGLYTDKVGALPSHAPQASDVGRDPIADYREAIAAIYGSDWDPIAKPVAAAITNSVSPLLYDDRMSMSLINSARLGQPSIISPAVMGGLSAPMTLGGMITVQNTEFLAGLVLVQAVRPGQPVGYGNVSTLSDMKVGMPAYGSPEGALSTVSCAQLARRYGIPSRGGGAFSEGKIPDVQAGFEHMLTMLISVLTGINLLTHTAGVIESMLAVSYELLVLDQDAIGMCRRIVEGPPITREEIAVDVIKDVGPQGMFLTHEHTFNTFKRAYFEPRLMDRQIYAEWAKKGATSAAQRATAVWKQLVADYKGPEVPLPDDAIRYFHERIRRIESLMDDKEDWPRHLVGLGAPALR